MPDIDDMVASDGKKVRDAYQSYKHGDGTNITFPAVLEGTLWSFAGLFALGMFAAMPWVGEGKAIAGGTWMALGMGGMLLFGSFAFGVRFIRTHSTDIDRTVEHKMRR